MRILEAFGEPISNGGQESFVMNVVTHMNMSNKTVDLLTPYYCDNEHYKNKIESLGGKIFTFNKPFTPGKSRFNICDAIDDFFKNNKYDVVHVHSGSISIFGIYAYYAKKNGVKKVIVHSHSSIEKKSLKNTILRYVCNLFLKNNVDIYCACSCIAGESKFVESVVKNKLVIIKNGIDVEKFKFNEVTRKNLRCSLNIEDDEFIVGHVGRFSDEKNHTFLIDVFKQIVKLKPNSKLILIGSGELEDIIKEKVVVSIIFRKFYFPFVKNKIIPRHNLPGYLSGSCSYSIYFPIGYWQRVVNGRKQASMHFPRQEMHLWILYVFLFLCLIFLWCYWF